MTKSAALAKDVSNLLRARVPVLWVVTREEQRVEHYLAQAAQNAGYVPRTWDIAQGACNIDGSAFNSDLRDPGEMLASIATRARFSEANAERCAWVFRDLPVWLAGPPGAAPLRQLCNLARSRATMSREAAQAVIVITPEGNIPPELAGHVTVVEWPVPDREEIAAILDAQIAGLPDDIRGTAVNGAREAAIDAAVGLTGSEAEACYAKSLVQSRTIDPALVAAEKKRVISREKVLEWFDPIPGGLDAVGGLEVLKAWLVSRASAYSPEARAYGLPAPRGALLAGVPGCGKSLTAKAVATAWKVPLLRLDMGALKSKFVGGSEQNLRQALRTIEAIGRCVVWVDEIEKALQGATSGSSDGGVSSDALGTLLSWMQERTGESFILATANDVDALPQELLRKGRFDDVWFIDLPSTSEREAILAASLRSFKRTYSADDLVLVGRATAGFSGAEVAALVPDAMYAAFADGARAITADDLLAAARDVVPASKANAEKLAKLRAWASRARLASTPEATVVELQPARRSLDI